MIQIPKQYVYFSLILILALTLRLIGINWDSNFHLHPDERFLTMVGNAMQLPTSLKNYFSSDVSTFNPPNIGYKFFVYGTFPLIVTKLFALGTSMDTYNSFTLLGRFLSAVADIMVIFFIYKSVRLLEMRYKLLSTLKLWAAFFYAIAVLPIQLSHFFTVDQFLNLTMMASFYFMLRYIEDKKIQNIVISAVLFGLALASKISAIYILPLQFLILAYGVIWKKEQPLLSIFGLIKWQQLIKVGLLIGLFLLISLFILRLADPYFFQTNNFLDLSINKTFLQNLQQLKAFTTRSSAAYYPPATQWFDKKPLIFPLTNIIFFGLGIGYFVVMLIGLIRLFLQKQLIPTIIAIWVIGFFLYQGSQFSPTMRYFIFLYPFFAIFAAFGWQYLLSIQHIALRRSVIIIALIGILIWPISFIHIYTVPHSRVTASYWINENIPENSFLALEHWDDWLPLNLANIANKHYQAEQMPVFAPDSDEKWQQINTILSKADYIIFTSNRGYGSIINQPNLYPKMARFYKDLFAEKLSFTKIKEITSYPELKIGPLSINYPDDWAEEAFTVYDHPKVIIFKKMTKWENF